MKDLTNFCTVTTNDDTTELFCNFCAPDHAGPNVEIQPRYTWEDNSADSPTHCPDCGELLEQSMTDFGLDYVRENIREALEDGNTLSLSLEPDSVLGEWHTFYGEQVRERVAVEDGIDFDAITDNATVLQHYLVTMLWTGTLDFYTNTPEFGGESLTADSILDSVLTVDKLPADIVEQATKDVDAFLESISPWLPYWENVGELTAEQLGHDFSLTRNGHGAGFWDRGYGPMGDWLTRWAKSYGEASLYGCVVIRDLDNPSLEPANLLLDTLQVWSSN